MSNTVRNRSKSNKNIGKSEEIYDEKPKNIQTRTSTNQSLSLKILTRVVVIFSLLIIVYFTSKEEKIRIFARHSDVLSGKGQVVECSKDYLKEIDKYEGCFPKQCGRLVTDTVISEREANGLLAMAQKGLKFGGSSGGASIMDLHSGALSKGKQFINIYKMKEAQNVFTNFDFQLYTTIKEKIKFAVADHFGVYPDKIFLTHPTFFSEITAKEAVTVHDEYWHPHIDKETYKSFHYTTLLYLNEYNVDYKGGRFIFVDDQFNSTVEPRKARLSIFTSGGENLHYVEKVTSGVRYAITISFTCDKTLAIEQPTATNKLS